MSKILVDLRHIPPLPNAGEIFKLGLASIFALMRIVGSEIRDGIRHYTPHRSWHLWRKCKVVGYRTTVWTARVKVGWIKSDFPRGQFYAVYVGEGTGIHVPGGRKIFSRKKTAKVALIRYPYHGGWVAVKSTRGQKPQKMLEKGYEKAVPEILYLMSRTMYRTMRTYKHA